MAMSMSVDHCCNVLSQSLASKVYFPTSSQYILTEEAYWSAQEGAVSPACVIVPTSTEDVSESVAILAGSNCPFAIKGGGHTPAAGAANIQAGVTIDLAKLNSVTVDTEDLIASIGGGATWIDAYLYLETRGLAVAGGRNGPVGVGGLTLGGGISYFSPRVGWACDNVVNFEVVLASGDIVNANAKSNDDLWRALKGGSNNFGIVTRFDLLAFPQGELWGGVVVQSITGLEAAFDVLVNLTTSPHYDPFASFVMSTIFDSTSQEWVMVQIPDYTKAVENPSIFEALLAIEPQISSTVRIANLSDLVSEGATLPGAPQSNQVFYTMTIDPNIELLNSIISVANSTIYEFFPGSVDSDLTWSFTFEPLPTIITHYGDLKGGNSLGTTPKDGDGIVILFVATWNSSALSSEVNKVAAIITEEIQNLAKKRGQLHEFQYLNYAHPTQKPLQSYGIENFENLKEVSRKFDPKGVFQRLVPGGFKLG